MWFNEVLKNEVQLVEGEDCCELIRNQLPTIKNFKDLPDAYVEYVWDADCDRVLELFEELKEIRDSKEGGLQKLSMLLGPGINPTVGELSAILEISNELLSKWRECEKNNLELASIGSNLR